LIPLTYSILPPVFSFCLCRETFFPGYHLAAPARFSVPFSPTSSLVLVPFPYHHFFSGFRELGVFLACFEKTCFCIFLMRPLGTPPPRAPHSLFIVLSSVFLPPMVWDQHRSIRDFLRIQTLNWGVVLHTQVPKLLNRRCGSIFPPPPQLAFPIVAFFFRAASGQI